MELLVLRHGRAGTWDPDRYPDDRDRPLTDNGRARLARQVHGMAAIGVRPDAVVSSPLARALQTAQIVVEGLDLRLAVGTMDELLPGADPRSTLRRIAADHPRGACVMIVGHEPHLSALISLAVTGSPSPIVPMRKGALCKLSLWPAARIEWSLTARQMIRMR